MVIRVVGDVLVWGGAAAWGGAALVALVGDRGGFGWWKRARSLAQLGAVALAAATTVLAVALVDGDLSIEYVADQRRAGTSWPYRLAGVWAGAEGSLLWFTTLLGAVAAWYIAKRTDRGRVAARLSIIVGSLIVAWSTVVVATLADPFVTLPIPAIRGAGLTPILEHPAMLYHPPILYAGSALTMVPFLDGVGGQSRWWTRSATTTAWALLTIGLATGANWAYVEVGWGGWWAWDPVENTILIPWLVLTAAIHARRCFSGFHRWDRWVWNASLGLTMAPFVFVLFGSAVTRSGGLSSVHAFADSTRLGWTLGGLCAIATLAAIWALTGRHGHTWTGARTDPLAAPARAKVRLIWVSLAPTLLLGFALVVLVGTATPLVTSIGGVDADYYQRVGAPVLGLALIIMIVVPALFLIANMVLAVAAIVVGLGVGFWLATWLGIGGLLGVLVALAATVTVLHLICVAIGTALARPWAMAVGHIGLAVLVVGVAGTASSQNVRRAIPVGESVTVAAVTVSYDEFEVVDGPRPGSELNAARVTITESGSGPVRRQVGLVNYPDRGVVLAETALHSTPVRDVQVVLSAVSDDGLGVFEVGVRPAVMWVWWGAALIALAGLILLVTDGRGRFRRELPRRPPPPPAHDRSPRPDPDDPLKSMTRAIHR